MNATRWALVTAAVGQAASKVCAALVLLGVVDLTADQIAGLVVAVEALLAVPLAVIGITTSRTNGGT